MAASGFTRSTHLSRASTLAVGCLLAAGCGGYSEKEVRDKVNERVNKKTFELRIHLAEDVVKLFLTGILEEDYAGAQILLERRDPLVARAKDAPGREKALREFVRGWLADGRDAFVYFDNDARGRAPWDAVGLLERLGS